MTDPASETDPVDEQVDTTRGDRDPLTTDDGLAEASEGIPQIDDRDGDQADGDPFAADQEPVPAPGLEVDDDGNDPLVDEPVG